MEIRIGIRDVAREIVIETEETHEEVAVQVAEAMAGRDAVLSLTDSRGRRVLVPANALGYVDIGAPEKSRVGFGA